MKVRYRVTSAVFALCCCSQNRPQANSDVTNIDGNGTDILTIGDTGDAADSEVDVVFAPPLGCPTPVNPGTKICATGNRSRAGTMQTFLEHDVFGVLWLSPGCRTLASDLTGSSSVTADLYCIPPPQVTSFVNSRICNNAEAASDNDLTILFSRPVTDSERRDMRSLVDLLRSPNRLIRETVTADPLARLENYELPAVDRNVGSGGYRASCAGTLDLYSGANFQVAGIISGDTAAMLRTSTHNNILLAAGRFHSKIAEYLAEGNTVEGTYYRLLTWSKYRQGLSYADNPMVLSYYDGVFWAMYGGSYLLVMSRQI